MEPTLANSPELQSPPEATKQPATVPSTGHDPNAQGEGSVEVVKPKEKDTDVLDPDYVGPAKTVKQDVSIAQEADPMRQQTGPHGTYLDREQRLAAEIARAKVEGREPDLENPPPIAGTPVFPTDDLAKRFPADPKHEIPVLDTVERVVGTDDPTTLRPEDHAEYERNSKAKELTSAE